MSWQFGLIILLIINTGSVVLTKMAADKLPKERSKGIFFQYLFCAIIATFYALPLLIAGGIDLSLLVLGAGTVGFINAFGNYCQWQASARSLSKTTLFFPLMEAITIVLAVIFLNEVKLWNYQLLAGAGLCFLAMWLFRLPKKGKDEVKKTTSRQWFFFILAMVLIFGAAGFLVKFFSATLARETFLMSWYWGAFLGSLPILKLEKQNPLKVSRQTILIVLPVSLAILGALFALYWTYQLGGPVSLVLPIRGLAITIIPIIIGWHIFKERKGLTKREWLAFAVGLVGAVLVLLR